MNGRTMCGIMLLGALGCSPPLHEAVTTATQEMFAKDGTFKNVADDPILAPHQRRFELDRAAIVKSHAAFFAIPSPTSCALEPAFMDQLGQITREREDPNNRFDDVAFGVQGGTCENGKALGDVTVVLRWKRTIRLPGVMAGLTTSSNATMKLVGTLGPSGFTGPLAFYVRESKAENANEGQKSSLNHFGDAQGDFTFKASYVNLASYYPNEVHRERGVTFSFDSKDTAHMVAIIDPLPDGRHKVVVWSGSRKALEQSMKPNGKIHGWSRSPAQQINGITIPASDTCMLDGEVVKTNDCP